MIPSKNDTQETFMPKCIKVMIDEGFSNEQAIAICEQQWEAYSQNKLRKWETDEYNDGAFAIGLVTEPAIEEDFIYFSKDFKKINLKVDEEKRLIIGPALIPYKPIIRYDDDGNDYYAYFSPETIKQIAHNFLAKKHNNNVTYNHERPLPEGIELYESWVVENKDDKINTIYGFQLPVGTWCLAYHVSDDKIWDDIKNGKLNGYSIEAILNEIQLSKNEEDIDVKLIEELIDFLKNENNNKIKLNKPIIISFEIDGVLTKKKFQKIAKENIGNGIRVVVVTNRNEKDMPPVYEYCKQLGITTDNVFFSSGTDKLPILQRIGVTTHYDVDNQLIERINKTGEIVGIIVN